jgi:hypothetical protein
MKSGFEEVVGLSIIGSKYVSVRKERTRPNVPYPMLKMDQ